MRYFRDEIEISEDKSIATMVTTMEIFRHFNTKLLQHRLVKKFYTALPAAILFFAMIGVMVSSSSASSKQYVQNNLVADVSGLARSVDTNLVDPWGLVQSPSGQWWLADNDTGVITLYTEEGLPYPSDAPLSIIIPLPPDMADLPATPTGIITNPSKDFILGTAKPARVICVTKDGTISGWNPEVDKNHAVLAVDKSKEAVYNGVTIGQMEARNYLYVANFTSGAIDVFDIYFHQINLPDGAFDDVLVPDDFAPSNVQNINGNIYVAYAQQDEESYDAVSGSGLGYVTVYNMTGRLLMRLQSGPWMNVPWGMALAPSNFGKYSGMLLVGNAGNGTISAFDPNTGKFKGLLEGTNGNFITIQGLHGIGFGQSEPAGQTAVLYFSAGIAWREHGLFGSLRPSP
jgi:uncharacterized protein (TIGR03118 family)